MSRIRSHFLGASAMVLVFGAILTSVPVMAESLPNPISISTDFVEAIGQTPEWLAGELEARNLPGEWKIEDGKLVTADLDVIRYAHRIEAFVALDPGDEFPYFVLPLVDQDGDKGTCVTLYPRDILPKLGAMDFRQEQFLVPDLGAEEITKCLVKGPSGEPFETMDRTTFRSHYFLESGDLDVMRFEALDGNPDLINRAYELGFYSIEADDPGILRIR